MQCFHRAEVLPHTSVRHMKDRSDCPLSQLYIAAENAEDAAETSVNPQTSERAI